MPRVRYYKNYEQFNERETPNLGEESSSEGINYQEQKGWWSNASVISSLSDKKIKQAIANYKAIISLLQIELLERSRGVRHIDVFPLQNFKDTKNCKNNLVQTTRSKKGTKKLECILKEAGLSEIKIKELVELWQQNVSGKQL